mmetsp:Transcript_971/g.2929  ORF Transcript_971/g.2929 Transcript_971/m.2929 type:complete len:280 (-) Transcript_971:276-1115(-)
MVKPCEGVGYLRVAFAAAELGRREVAGAPQRPVHRAAPAPRLRGPRRVQHACKSHTKEPHGQQAPAAHGHDVPQRPVQQLNAQATRMQQARGELPAEPRALSGWGPLAAGGDLQAQLAHAPGRLVDQVERLAVLTRLDELHNVRMVDLFELAEQGLHIPNLAWHVALGECDHDPLHVVAAHGHPAHPRNVEGLLAKADVLTLLLIAQQLHAARLVDLRPARLLQAGQPEVRLRQRLGPLDGLRLLLLRNLGREGNLLATGPGAAGGRAAAPPPAEGGWG